MGTWAGALLCSFLPGGSGFCEAGAGRRQLAAEEDAIRVGGLARVPGCPRSGSGRSELVGPLRTGDVLSHWDRALPPVIPTSMRRLLGGWGAFPLQSHPASPTQRAGWSPLVGPPTRSPSVPEGSHTAVLGLRLHRVGGRVCAEQPPSLGEGRFPVCVRHTHRCADRETERGSFQLGTVSQDSWVEFPSPCLEVLGKGPSAGTSGAWRPCAGERKTPGRLTPPRGLSGSSPGLGSTKAGEALPSSGIPPLQPPLECVLPTRSLGFCS